MYNVVLAMTNTHTLILVTRTGQSFLATHCTKTGVVRVTVYKFTRVHIVFNREAV